MTRSGESTPFRPLLRALTDTVTAMPQAERVTLLEALARSLAREMPRSDFEGLLAALRLDGESARDAAHPSADAAPSATTSAPGGSHPGE